MAKFFFSGSTSAKLDEKGRFVLPQQMRFGLIEEGVLEFSLGLGLGGCLAIYRQSDIQKIVEKFQAKQHLGKYQKFFTLFFSTLHQTTCDKVGRVIIPPTLKQAVGIKTEITIAGVLNKIEIWPKERYESQLNAVLSGRDPEMNLAKLTEEAFALLDEGKAGGQTAHLSQGILNDLEVLRTPANPFFEKAHSFKGESASKKDDDDE
jgi:MraZ protein